MWVYQSSEPGLYTVGFYTPQGEWRTDSDHQSKEEAALRVHYLNGGSAACFAQELRTNPFAEAEPVTDWVPEERNAKTFGAITLTPLRPRGGGEGAHYVYFGDGRAMRVLPTASKSARARYAVLAGALIDCVAIDCVAIGDKLGPIGAFEAFDPFTYVAGRLSLSNIPWESAGSLHEVTIEEWLAYWFEDQCDEHVTRPDYAAEYFLDRLADDGWEIRRKEVES